MSKGKHIVIWQICKKGFWNSLFGKKMIQQKNVIHSYDSEEITEHGFKSLKSNGCIKPLLIKVLKE